MKNAFFKGLKDSELFPGSDIMLRYTRKMTGTRDSYTLLARANNKLAAVFADTRVKSALFPKKDCFECLSPHDIAVAI
jgi:hypothetical protein